MTERVYRVIQWATGSIGQISIRHFATNPNFELVGALVTSDAKVGVDAGTLADIDPLGVVATKDVDEILALDADCVNYAPLHADVDDMCRILRSGKNIVTPVGFVYPKAMEAVAQQALQDACAAGATSLFGAGIHPGFSGDLLPMTFARLCTRIDKVIVQEVADLAPHPSAAMFQALGFGRDPVEAVKDPMPLINTMERIFQESMTLIADGLGIPIEDFTTDFEVAVAKRHLVVKSGEIPPGTVGGMRFEWSTWSGGRPVIVFRTFWKMDDDLDPDWGYGTVKYSMEIEGEPSVKVGFEPSRKHPTGDEGYWGRVWTAMNAVNAIPAVVDAAPGIVTHLDLPLIKPLGLVPAQAS